MSTASNTLSKDLETTGTPPPPLDPTPAPVPAWVAEPAPELPYLSFCLIIRNCASTLEACLQSIRERAPDAEIICVDTCSRDDSGTDVFFDKATWKEITDAEVETKLASAGLKLLFIDEWARLA